MNMRLEPQYDEQLFDKYNAWRHLQRRRCGRFITVDRGKPSGVFVLLTWGVGRREIVQIDLSPKKTGPKIGEKAIFLDITIII